MGKWLIRVFILGLMPTGVLFSCPAKCLFNVAECSLPSLRAAISTKKFDANRQSLEQKIIHAEKQYLKKHGYDAAENKELLSLVKNKAEDQARKDLLYVIAIAMSRLPKLFDRNDEKMAARIEIIAKLYPMALYINTLKSGVS